VHVFCYSGSRFLNIAMHIWLCLSARRRFYILVLMLFRRLMVLKFTCNPMVVKFHSYIVPYRWFPIWKPTIIPLLEWNKIIRKGGSTACHPTIEVLCSLCSQDVMNCRGRNQVTNDHITLSILSDSFLVKACFVAGHNCRLTLKLITTNKRINIKL